MSIVYQAASGHPHAELLNKVATASEASREGSTASRDERVRAWLASVGAPLGSAAARGSVPPLELAGRFGDEPLLVDESRGLFDGRRRRVRMFFSGPHGPRALAATRRNTPREARRWGYLMNMGLDSYQSTFDRFARP